MLNTKQKEVVFYHGGSLVNVAGPGSGKTFTLIERIKHLVSLANGDESLLKRMLVLTFTNSAALEIRDRALQKFKYTTPHHLYFGTYHAIFKKIMVEEGIFKTLGLGTSPTLSTPNETKRNLNNQIKNAFEISFPHLVTKALQKDNEKNFTHKLFKKHFIDVDSILNTMETIVNKTTANDLVGITSVEKLWDHLLNRTLNELYKEITRDNIFEGEDTKTFGALFVQSFSDDFQLKAFKVFIHKHLILFIEEKTTQKLVTFNDIILLTLFALCSHPDFKSKIKSNFDHIFIDEFQDTNIIQNEILKQIQNNNICIIGDPYQSIYGFLGGNVDNILGAPKDYNAKVIQLMENYRSNQNIVDYTNYLASKMIESVDSWIPNISSSGVKNNKIGVMLYTDESQQRQFITDTIKGLGQRKTYAIISRSGFDFITEKFLNHNKIKFNKLGGLSLKESVEVQSFTMLYTYVLNTDKLNALAYVLPRVEGIGETSVDGYIKDLKSKESKKKTPKKIQEFLDKLNNQLEVNAKPKTNSEVVSLTLRIKSIYDEYIIPKITKSWKEDRVKLAKQKVAVILEELMEQKNYIEVSTTLDDYYFDKNEKRDEQKSNVTVSTIHSAKGLEWDVVFLVDWESKSFNRDDIKEAQRLNYVAVSRAKEELFLLSGDSIFELPKEVINSDTLGHLFEKIEVSDKEDKESTTINFGKYKGYDVSELPPSYLYWLYENKVDFKKKKLLTDSLIKTIEKMIF